MKRRNSTGLLKNLNEKQRQAVEALEGPVLVVAGPGTGKTHLLTTRIAHILSATDTDPKSILCLTFTENGATEMRKRLSRWIGKDAYKIHISTFHGFCQWVMDHYPDAFELTRGERVLADDLQKALLYRQIIDQGTWKKLKPFKAPYSRWRDFNSAISNLKKENITPDVLKDLIPVDIERQKADPANYYKRKYKTFNAGDPNPVKMAAIDSKAETMYELADMWALYEKEMEQAGLYDFDDMITWVLQTIEHNGELKAELQERFLYTLVDEYQDTNNAQNALLWHLTDYFENPNLFAVGDDDQSIYRFQGASLQNMLDFKNRFPQGQIIELDENYRSAQSILDCAYASVKNNLERINDEKHLVAAGDNASYTPEIIQATLAGRWSEIVWIADKITSEIEAGIPPEDIAILCRTNREVQETAQLLKQFGLPVRSRITQNIFEDEYVLSFLQLLEVVVNPFAERDLLQMLHAPWWNIERHTLMQLTAKAERKSNFLVLLAQGGEALENEELKALLADEALKNALELIYAGRRTWGKRISGYGIAQEVFYSSGIGKWISEQNNDDRLVRLNTFKALLQWMHALGSLELEAILERTKLHQELGIAVYPDPLPADKHAVNILTAHGSKGSEYEVVVMPGLLDKTWGNRRKRAGLPIPELAPQNHDDNEEERRLFFVAVTRAKKKLIMTHSESDMSGKEKVPSMFWHEIPSEIVASAHTDETESKAQELLPVFFSAEKPVFTEEEKHILENLTQRYVWSATGLENYLTCPKKFLYVNLLGIPSRQNQNMAYGSAMHKALEDFFRVFKKNKILPEISELLRFYEEAVTHLVLPAHEKDAVLNHGLETLKAYYEQKSALWSPDVVTEMSFRKYKSHVGDIPVTGIIDKLEIQDDGTAVCVDYKTGSPKKIVPGERLWRQLVFYDVMVRNTPQMKYDVTTYAVEFLTPDRKEKFQRTEYSVTDEDRDQLIAELTDSAQKVLNLEFPNVLNLEGDAEIDTWQNFGNLG